MSEQRCPKCGKLMELCQSKGFAPRQCLAHFRCTCGVSTPIRCAETPEKAEQAAREAVQATHRKERNE